MTGTPVSASKRLQFNMDVVPIPKVEMMKNLRKMVFPTFWVEESVNLPPAFTDPMKKMFLYVVTTTQLCVDTNLTHIHLFPLYICIRMLKIQKWVQWICMAIGLLGR